MPAKVSPLLKVLRELRDDARRTNERIDHLEERLAGELGQVTAVLRDVKNLLTERLDDRGRLDDHELRLRALERKAG